MECHELGTGVQQATDLPVDMRMVDADGGKMDGHRVPIDMKLPLHPRRRDALDEQALEEEEEQEDRHEAQYAHGEEAPIVGLAGGVHEGSEAEHHRVLAHLVEVDQRPKEIVPGP